MEPKITLLNTAEGAFPFKIMVEKARPMEEEGEMYVEGVASTTNVDHDKERMSAGSLNKMARIINNGKIPLRVEHQRDTENPERDKQFIIGEMEKAWVDERNQLWVRAKLNKSNPVAGMMYGALKGGSKLGLSVAGKVRSAATEFVESVGKQVKTYYDIALEEISATYKPSNYDAWLVAKSYIAKGEDSSGFQDSPIHNQFLMENPRFDYLEVIAKSIPDEAWKKVVNKNNNEKTMTEKDKTKSATEETETETKTKAQEETTKEETAEETTKSVQALKSYVETGFSKLTDMISTLAKNMKKEEDEKTETDKTEKGGETAEDQTDPEETKGTEKAQREGQSDSEGNGDDETGTREKKNMDSETDADETKTKEKAQSEKTETEAFNSEESKEKSEYGADYKIETLERAMKSMTELAEALTQGVKKSSVSDSASEVSVQDFANALGSAVDKMVQKNTESKVRVPGLEQFIADIIKHDPEIQSIMKSMNAQPGVKKSAAVPFFPTKEGKRYAIVPQEIGVKKSQTLAGKSFKEVYQQNFSALSGEENSG